MKVLGIDVCTGFCSVALVDGDRPSILKHEAMTRGHAERLAPMVSEVIEESGYAPADLDGIAVTTGPGSFTGARLGVSFARGLALASGTPTVGVSVFEALAADQADTAIIALDGKNGSFLIQPFCNGKPTAEAAEYLPEAAAEIFPDHTVKIIGPAASTLAQSATPEVREKIVLPAPAGITAETVAILGISKLNDDRPAPPAPLYLRPADAKPQAVVSLA